MDADTAARLKTNFAPGVMLAASHASIKMKIGERKVLGVALRSVLQATTNYQVNYSLYESYDRSTNIITRETPDVQPWIDTNGVSPADTGYLSIELNQNGEKIYPFVLEIKPTFADGKPTKPGTYVFEFIAYKMGSFQLNEKYASVRINVLVE